jgi:hypothetical protein
MTNTLIGIWLLLYGAMALISTKVPEWIVPGSACIIGLILIAGGGWWKKSQ